MSAPRVTVLMPVYDAARHLGAAVASVLAQRYADFELLVIDDGSSDESLEVLGDFRDKRLRIERHARNRGLIETLNAGLRLARGAYLARMDADDLSHPERFAAQVAYLDAHPDVAGVSCAYDLVDERGRPLADDYGLFRPTDPWALDWSLHFGCHFTHGGAMLRTDVLRAAGGFDAGYPHAEDYELWLRLAAKARLANLARVLLTVREHRANVSTRHREVQRRNAYRALHAALERRLARAVPAELVAPLRDGALPDSPAQTRALAALHLALFAVVAQDAPPAARRAIAGDLAQRLGVLAARALRPQPSAALGLAALGLRHGARGFARAWSATRRGDPLVYRRSPAFEPAG